MNLRLKIFKTNFKGDYNTGRHIRFAVVDMDKSKEYPANYVCLLPANPRANGKVHSTFSRLFENDSLELAKTLLAKASITESDLETKAEIERRLGLLEPKPPVQAKCHVCGKCFEPRKRGRSKQRICKECKQKMYANQT
jgi:hypothetical protein